MANKECAKCIHNAVCKTAESCDGYVSGCEHFKEKKQGRWERWFIFRRCSVCHFPFGIFDKWDYCPNCGADMRGEEE